MLSTEQCARLVDQAVRGRVLVHGSLPGQGRDLDLLVRPAELASIESALADEGFSQRGHDWVRFRCCDVEQVETIPASSWGLPDQELSDLFELAVPIEGYSWLVRPCPAHTILILARRVVEGSGRLDQKRRGYLEWALESDPEAWAGAVSRAHSWQAERALELLSRLGGSAFVPASTRAAVIARRLEQTGRGPVEAWLEGARRVVPSQAAPAVVALSGLDGSGKSTQARLLADSLERIGIPTACEWAKLGEDRRLWKLRSAGKRLVAVLEGGPGPKEGESAQGSAGPRAADSAPVVQWGWAALAAASNVWTLRRQVRRYRGKADVIVYDRYVLDTAAHLRWRYGLRGAPLVLLERAVAAVAPKPLAAFYLQVEAETARERKGEEPLEILKEHATAYAEALLGSCGRSVRVLDGSEAPEALAAQIGTAVWEGGAGTPRRGLLRRLASRALRMALVGT